ncbi:MAG: DMT family transporter [Methylobacteriaceae bacterium]|nr:DMT family transporter [Methylobacteriaceae bacterium]
MRGAFATAVLAVGLLSAMDAVVKAQAATYATLQIAVLRFAFGSLAILATFAVVQPPRPHLSTILANTWRAMLGAATVVAFFYALARLPLAETLALALLAPCFTVLFGALLLREKVGTPIIVALGVGLAGMLLIVAPKFTGPSLSVRALEGTAAVLLSTLTYSLSLVLLRSRATRDHPVTIVAVQNVGCCLILACLLPFAAAVTWPALISVDMLAFIALGVFGVLGHLLLARAYGMAPAAILASADYTSLIYAAVFGYVFFAETPALTTIAGSALIIASSLAATRR